MIEMDQENYTEEWNHTLGADENGTSVHPAFLAASYMTYRVAVATHVYVLPFIVAIGLVGNCLSFLIMLKPHNRRISCCNYIAALAVSDTLMLFNALDYWTISLKNRPLFYIECNIMSYLFGANSFVSMLLIFAMTVDRFLAIRFPFKARVLCSTYRARVAIVAIVVTSLLYTLPYYFTAQLIKEVRTCVAVNTTDIYSTVYNWVNIFLGSIVPFCGLLTMNAFIIATVRQRGDFSAGSGDKDTTRDEGNTTECSIDGTAQASTSKDNGIQNNKDNGIKNNKDNGIKNNKDNGIKNNKDNGIKNNKDNGIKNNKDNGIKNNKDNGIKNNKARGVHTNDTGNKTRANGADGNTTERLNDANESTTRDKVKNGTRSQQSPDIPTTSATEGTSTGTDNPTFQADETDPMSSTSFATTPVNHDTITEVVELNRNTDNQTSDDEDIHQIDDHASTHNEQKMTRNNEMADADGDENGKNDIYTISDRATNKEVRRVFGANENVIILDDFGDEEIHSAGTSKLASLKGSLKKLVGKSRKYVVTEDSSKQASSSNEYHQKTSNFQAFKQSIDSADQEPSFKNATPSTLSPNQLSDGTGDQGKDAQYQDKPKSESLKFTSQPSGSRNNQENQAHQKHKRSKFLKSKSQPSSTHNDQGNPTPNQHRPRTKSLKLTPQPSVKHRTTTTTSKSGSRENQLTIMLLLVTFTFLLLTVPVYVRYLLAIFWNYTGTVKHYADYLLLAHLSNRLFYMNSACNFFLYCISGNKFRQDVKSLFVKG